MSKCPSCRNEFKQPFVCTTCGAEKLHNETMRVLEQQLAEREKQIVMLRDALIESSPLMVLGNSWKTVGIKVRDALAATQDLSGLRLCDAESVGEVEHIDIDEDAQPSAWIRLYVDVELGDQLFKARTT